MEAPPINREALPNDKKREREEEEEEKGKMRRTTGESRGTVQEDMNVDTFDEEQWAKEKDRLYENKIPVLKLEGRNKKRIIQE